MSGRMSRLLIWSILFEASPMGSFNLDNQMQMAFLSSG